MLKGHVILGIHITNRVEKSHAVQQVFTEFGCNIKTRIGLHDVDDNYCSPNGLLLIEFIGSQDECDRMKGELASIKGVEVQSMAFDHP